MTGQRVLVCGGRNYNDRAMVESVLSELSPSKVCHGAAAGADTLAAHYCADNDIPARAYLAEWTRHGKAAGAIRNTQMLHEFKPDLVVAFPGGKGTAHMVKIAREAGVPVLEVEG